ncbi:pentatricopeptide repeat domain-containing protein 3, mitochondrial [Mugil cephalus]|uniref:pentatricopeptide repeat domain-containing protein 3, mitochondrial n=1 Tax=Mugil cephalus TaxID=48193 RepID=UPI001FB7BC64|nr:pentatricopeptide repeat domain-containing protein 3, mitochondrial [Mugil cephalus]
MVSPSQKPSVRNNMAAPGKHVGHYIQRNGRLVFSNLEQLFGHRSFGWTAALRQQAAEANTESTESIVIPKKKTWSKDAVLQALASTVSRDPTAYPYQFQDDPFLSPRNSLEFRMFSFSQESGRSAAKYFINTNPKFFTKDFAEPHIPCLMPESVALRLEEVSEDALKERISLRKVTAAVNMYDQLMQAGTPISTDTTHDLLDLISLYCDRDPVRDEGPQTENAESGEEPDRRRGRGRRAADFIKVTWKESNNAERIFNLLPERDTRCYSALIRGMVKHQAFQKAFSFYTDLLNNKVPADVHIFNALISAVSEVREKYEERWELITELLIQMNRQKIRPNLMTFNSVLKTLRRCGYLARSQAFHILSEMKALGIEPSLATYNHLLVIFYKPTTGPSNQNVTEMLQEVMAAVEGVSFTCQDPEDVHFFSSAMRICLEHKDLELGYKVHSLIEVGENWRLQGESHQQAIYYGRFFNLLCMMEHIDVVMKWYKQMVSTVYYPNSQGLSGLLQAMDTDNRLDLVPTIWKDIKLLGHDNKPHLVDELLSLMARDKQSPEVQKSFGECALEVKSVFDGKPEVQWSASSFSHVTNLLLQANMIQPAWEMLRLFKSRNRVPSGEVLNNFLSVCQSNAAPEKAVELVQLSAAYCLPATAELAKRALAEFKLTEEQRAILSELDTAGEPSD